MKKLMLVMFISLLSACGTSTPSPDNHELKAVSSVYNNLDNSQQEEIINKDEASVETVVLDGIVTIFDENYRNKEVYKISFQTDSGEVVYFVSMDTFKVVAVPGLM